MLAPYGARFTTFFVTSNDGSSSNSTSATSGAPEPAFSALVIATYSGLPAPTSSWVTQMFGCVLLNSVTARPIPGTQAQNKTLVALGLHELPATTVTVGLALAVLAGELVVPPRGAATAAATAARGEQYRWRPRPPLPWSFFAFSTTYWLNSYVRYCRVCVRLPLCPPVVRRRAR